MSAAGSFTATATSIRGSVTPVAAATGPPTLNNPRGVRLEETMGVTLGFVFLAVFLRLWGRYRFRGPRDALCVRFGGSRFWVLLSDIAILLSLLMAIVLTIIACVGVHWGFGLHTKVLSVAQAHMSLEMFFVYQIGYKFAAGISKIATCCLLLAISTKSMTRFNLVCHIMLVYITGYCIACSIATVFQCDLDISSNWIHTNSQKHCFLKPPFWYTHAALNIFASVVIAGLPWWLFAYVTYRRKYTIATLMTLLSVSEIIFGCVRVKGLYISSHSLSDLTHGAVTGIVLSQLEVNFGIMAACIPTILKICEETFNRLFLCVTGRERTVTSTLSSRQKDMNLSTMKSQRDRYTKFGDEGDDVDSQHTDGSRRSVVPKEGIQVDRTFVMTSSRTTGKVGVLRETCPPAVAGKEGIFETTIESNF